ncbi:tRNA nucleotidyltransferase (CCA-adding enzyme) [Rhodotorula toruloides NP11]|uniref:tRNA nucleotidyltransferase (CCA-adding enzyme) n=1 Tax=Rhodotorula toruloides (strain NP11) TaxID=1130832 RepID=M7XTQ6_RHOT1|nr:tRNA nucleotidyltransferase (CCA-adding enzyme) [Rhodotorula toruloides NP11]EMS23613.1 tRNA nucleotidyltransferase (CCA-adding enzyme) [Rhodotorula toruloides NP11]
MLASLARLFSHRLVLAKTPLRRLPYTRTAMSTVAPVLPTISLTPNEAKLVQLLTDCADWVDQHPEEVDALRLKDDQGRWIGRERGTEAVELRVAGGWVRDKLLGRQSDDIDVSTSPDPITGLKFAMLFEKYLETLGQRDLMGRLTKIEAKPEQSKHLETATARVCDLSVDWVQQRGQEVYTEGSRIPTVAFGTPLEDAERRDLTINSLFYNLRTRLIEDQTGKGLSDLGFVSGQPKKIRTPLEPVKTFRDDPLRVVRAVRFAARFGREYELDAEMAEAIKREEIKEALRNPLKISRERHADPQLTPRRAGKDPHYAFELIESLELHPLIFLYEHDKCFPMPSTPSSPTASPSLSSPDPSASPAPDPDTSISVIAASLLTQLLNPSTASLPALHPLLQLHSVPLPDTTNAHSAPPTYPPVSPSPSIPLLTLVYPPTLKRLYLSCGLLPLYDLGTQEKSKLVWVGEKVVRDGVKGPSVDVGFVKRVREASQVLRRLVREVSGMSGGVDERMVDEAEERATIGMHLRNPSIHDGQHQRWNVSLLWSLVVDLGSARSDPAGQARLVEMYNRFVEKVISYELDRRAFEHPLLDGKTVNALLPFTKSSPAMPRILDLIMRYQLAHPSATKEDAERVLCEEERVEELRRLVEESRPLPKGKKRKEPK